MALLLDLTPLRSSAPFRRLWWGLGISNLGTQLTVVAVGLQVYAITGSTLSVGLLGICALIPLVALGLYGGALVDQYDRRKVALFSSLGLWLVVIALAAQAWLHVDSVPLLYALVAIQSAGFAINNPARSAIIPRLIDPMLLPAANVLQTIMWNVALTVGPLLGAFLVATWDFAEAYTIDFFLFTAALWALWRLPDLPPLTSEDPDATPSRRGLQSVWEGLRYLATRPNVRMTFVVDLIAMVLAMPRVLFPAVGVVFLGGGAATTGMLSAAFAVGAVLAGLFSGGLVQMRRQGRIIGAAIFGFGLAVAGFGVVLVSVGPTSPQEILVGALMVALVFLALAGASDAISSVFRQTILQSATPDSMRGGLHRRRRRRPPAGRPRPGLRGEPGRRGLGRRHRRPELRGPGPGCPGDSAQVPDVRRQTPRSLILGCTKRHLRRDLAQAAARSRWAPHYAVQRDPRRPAGPPRSGGPATSNGSKLSQAWASPS